MFSSARGVLSARSGHHSRQQFHAFVEIGRLHARQLGLIDGLGRCRLRVRIAAESHAETLPDALRLAIRNMFGTAKGQVLEQVGEAARSEEHTSELPSLMRTSYAVFCLKKKKKARYATEHAPIPHRTKRH